MTRLCWLLHACVLGCNMSVIALSDVFSFAAAQAAPMASTATQYHQNLAHATVCMQGVVCFESIMEAAERKGFVHEGTPVICKPSFKVCTAC